MSYISPYETEYQKFIRERSYRIAKAYIRRAGDILIEGIKPNRVMAILALKYEMTDYPVSSTNSLNVSGIRSQERSNIS